MTTLTIEYLKQLCEEREEESITLEFKSCNELRPGSVRRSGEKLSRQDMLLELSKDVSSMLNSAGGIIIYGIRERRSRAIAIDIENLYQGKDPRPEKVLHWIRSHIQPPPAVNVYRVFLDNLEDPERWAIVVDIPQGQIGYMAEDNRFYKRVGNVTNPMEQYEVVDAMNRSRSAHLVTTLKARKMPPRAQECYGIRLFPEISTENFIASDYGAIKLTIPHPLRVQSTSDLPRSAKPIIRECGLQLPGYDEQPHSTCLRLAWGASSGEIVFPGEPFDFCGGFAFLSAPLLPDDFQPVFLMEAETFTMNSISRKQLFAITDDTSQLLVRPISELSEEFHRLVGVFWETYHKARELKR